MNINTDRLQIREFTLEDAEGVFELYSTNELQKYIDGKELQSYKDAENLIDKYKGPHPFDKRLGVYAVVEKSSNRFVGAAFLVPLRDKEGNLLEDIEVGYHINKKYWNQGYATEISN